MSKSTFSFSKHARIDEIFGIIWNNLLIFSAAAHGKLDAISRNLCTNCLTSANSKASATAAFTVRRKSEFRWVITQNIGTDSDRARSHQIWTKSLHISLARQHSSRVYPHKSRSCNKLYHLSLEVCASRESLLSARIPSSQLFVPLSICTAKSQI